jgi:hypothetical protein
MVKTVQFITGIFLLIVLEVLRVYFIMPFPGSQHAATIDIAYFLHQNIFWFRFIGMLLILFPAVSFLWMGTLRQKVFAVFGILLYAFIFYLFNYRFVADKIFYQSEQIVFANSASNKIPQNDLVLGVHLDNVSRAYPIEIIGYHHQVRDTLGGDPVMITYCTVCRTGRAYSPVVNGKPEKFRLVGMDHYNAMFEDATTESWWRQVSGEAIAGPLKGSSLREIHAEQMTLRSWLDLHPDSQILQPDSTFKDRYEALKDYDAGGGKSALVKRDTLSWKEKSWIIGVQIGMQARAYDWNDIIAKRLVNDTLASVPILIRVGPDSASFHVLKRDSLEFRLVPGHILMRDLQTGSTWNWSGKSIEGPLKGFQLPVVQSYQEFWHSWKTFRPQTSKYQPK